MSASSSKAIRILKRILLPEEWQGYPLRKDYDILKQGHRLGARKPLGIESGPISEQGRAREIK